MRPPFPGMDPWLEDPAIWPDVHNSLIGAIRDALVPMVDPRYFVGVESRMVLYPSTDAPKTIRPDVALTRGRRDSPPLPDQGGIAVAEAVGVEVVELDQNDREEPIEETFVEVRETRSQRLVTILEVLSPSNKMPGKDRIAYLAKRDDLIDSDTHLVEIDLLRAGNRVRIDPDLPGDYRVLISRSPRRPRAQVFAWRLRVPLPSIPVPLLPDDPEPFLPLNTILHDLIVRARYFRRLDYASPPSPSLSDDDAAWANSVLKERPPVT